MPSPPTRLAPRASPLAPRPSPLALTPHRQRAQEVIIEKTAELNFRFEELKAKTEEIKLQTAELGGAWDTKLAFTDAFYKISAAQSTLGVWLEMDAGAKREKMAADAKLQEKLGAAHKLEAEKAAYFKKQSAACAKALEEILAKPFEE